MRLVVRVHGAPGAVNFCEILPICFLTQREKEKMQSSESRAERKPAISGETQQRLFQKPALFNDPQHDMAVNPSTCSPLLSRSPSTRTSLAFLSQSFLRPGSFPGCPAPGPFHVRCQKSPSDGFVSRNFLSADGSEAPAGSSLEGFSASAIDFLTLCHSLKTTKRKGWINHGIKGPESIADHMYRMALMALIAGDLPGVNRERCIKIALVHDIAEAIVGDITPSDGVPKEEKSRRESEALNEMCDVLGGGMRAEEIKELWAEYENNASLEANLVKDFDKVEMILQALEYETEHGKVLDEFFLSTAGKFQTEVGKSWAAEIISRRNSRLAKRVN